MKCGSDEEKEVLKFVRERAQALLSAKKVILFGSRARGDATDLSDFDIAVDTEEEYRKDFYLLRQELEENQLTLLPFDLVDIHQISEAFRQRIIAEGKEIII